jgi:hypothetical protein
VTMHGDEYREIDSVRIRMVRKATLHEVSLVPAGACRPTFCTIVDANGSRPPHVDAKGLRRGGATGFAWADNGIGYSLVGGAPAETLRPVANEVRRQARAIQSVDELVS